MMGMAARNRAGVFTPLDGTLPKVPGVTIRIPITEDCELDEAWIKTNLLLET